MDGTIGGFGMTAALAAAIAAAMALLAARQLANRKQQPALVPVRVKKSRN